VQVVGSTHSSDETCESRWSEGEDISFVSFEETLGTLEALVKVENEEKALAVTIVFARRKAKLDEVFERIQEFDSA
jgi:hypothetical protein